MGKIKYNPGDLIHTVLFIREVPYDKKTEQRRGLFKCPFCGNEYESRVNHVVGGKAISCGCVFKGKPKHYNASLEGYRSSEYGSWLAMIQRCSNKNKDNAERYIGKGVVVCEGWRDFRNFLADMGKKPTPKHSIDRYPDKKGNYSCGHCDECLKNNLSFNARWATKKEQSNNISNNLMVTYKGETKTLPQWCEELKLNYHRVRYRIFKLGLSSEIAFETPKQHPSSYNFNNPKK